jgi:hypothetical protein
MKKGSSEEKGPLGKDGQENLPDFRITMKDCACEGRTSICEFFI